MFGFKRRRNEREAAEKAYNEAVASKNCVLEKKLFDVHGTIIEAAGYDISGGVLSFWNGRRVYRPGRYRCGYVSFGHDYTVKTAVTEFAPGSWERVTPVEVIHRAPQGGEW